MERHYRSFFVVMMWSSFISSFVFCEAIRSHMFSWGFLEWSVNVVSVDCQDWKRVVLKRPHEFMRVVFHCSIVDDICLDVQSF